MKRQKRDKVTRAFKKGFQAGLLGKTRDLCPYQGVNIRANWLSGWREAMQTRSILGAK